jgi:hypothetical protein
VCNLIVGNIVSLDGFYEGPGGDVMALPFDEAFDIYRAERLRAADTLLVGRKSYEGLKSYRPPIADDPAAPPVEREVSRLENATDKVAVSDSLTPDQTTPWPNTDIVVHGHHPGRPTHPSRRGQHRRGHTRSTPVAVPGTPPLSPSAPEASRVLHSSVGS